MAFTAPAPCATTRHCAATSSLFLPHEHGASPSWRRPRNRSTPLAASQILQVLAPLPLATRLPSGEIATQATRCEPPSCTSQRAVPVASSCAAGSCDPDPDGKCNRRTCPAFVPTANIFAMRCRRGRT
ncbi:hypothetical protein T484DRAFT_1959465 [Baffinella frigidus]|nr:hypothetical protein T484DRAFT_1959465 [Cryptophyta sp. CCMP2293]